MPQNTPFTLGIEEEYLLVDAETLELTDAPEELMNACRDALGDQVAPEFLRCQIEVGTKVCASIGEARVELTHLRSTIARLAGEHGLAPIASACHPTADWTDQTHRDKPRYNDLRRDLAAVGQRMLICGMHIHVGLPDDELRIDLMNQIKYFLPHMLALSTSSPFWQGRDTGMASYRIGIFDNLPRTGLPPRFSSWGEYRRTVDILINAGLIEDTTKIWWDLRPSDRYPTLETRICDTCPRLSDALAIAALNQSLMRMLWRLRGANQRWRIYDNFVINENRWRAQRYGISEGLIDLSQGGIMPVPYAIDELIALTLEDARALGCEDDLMRLRDIASTGTSSQRQCDTFRSARDAGASDAEALKSVTEQLVAEFTQPG